MHYNTEVPLKKKSKLNYFAPHILRSLYLIKLNPIHNFSEKRLFTRSSKIPYLYCNKEVLIHRGNYFKQKRINMWNVGFNFGVFTWNRKLAIYKRKQKKKKTKILFMMCLRFLKSTGILNFMRYPSITLNYLCF